MQKYGIAYTAEVGPEQLEAEGMVLAVTVAPKGEGRGRSGRLLVDTGASRTCVDGRALEELGIKWAEEVLVGGVGGHHKTETYEVELSIGSPPVHMGITALRADLSAVGATVLLGRDVLRNCEISYHGGDGTYSLKVLNII